MATHNAVTDDKKIAKYSGRMLNGGNNTTIILLVDFMVLEVDGVVAVTLVKSPFLLPSLIDGLDHNNNALPSTMGK
jgi:hypothetical protein